MVEIDVMHASGKANDIVEGTASFQVPATHTEAPIPYQSSLGIASGGTLDFTVEFVPRGGAFYSPRLDAVCAREGGVYQAAIKVAAARAFARVGAQDARLHARMSRGAARQPRWQRGPRSGY